jgi:hypothetical protein
MQELTESQKIVKWNEERGLICKPEEVQIENEMSYIVEEVIEAMTLKKSKEARPFAKLICDAIYNGNITMLAQIIEDEGLNKVQDYSEPIAPFDGERVADACGDIKVFATGTIRKSGYNPDIVQSEVQEEIDSRVGSIIDGKFTKDMSPEAQANWYKADFKKALINT